MADPEAGVPAPNPPLAPVPALQALQVPQAPQAPQAPQGQQLAHLNWSYFNPEFSGKPDEDAEAHLHHTNDWMNAHHFTDGVKVKRFCLTLSVSEEARLHYVYDYISITRTMDEDQQGLQNLFRQQYSINRQHQRSIISCVEIF